MSKIYKDIPIGFHRVNQMPLDDSEIINGNEALFNYIQSGSAYNGQRIIILYENYQQPITLKVVGSSIIPVLVMPSGWELITKKYGDKTYALVYYYNKGAVFSSSNEIIRLTDPFAWSMLPQASILANSDSSIEYMLEIDHQAIYEITQPNFTSYNIPLPVDAIYINKISSEQSDNGLYTTYDPNITIMTKVPSDKLIELWVKCNDAYEMGV